MPHRTGEGEGFRVVMHLDSARVLLCSKTYGWAGDWAGGGGAKEREGGEGNAEELCEMHFDEFQSFE